MAATKSLVNSTPVSPTEVEDLVTSIQKDDATKSLTRIMKIYTQSHLYLSQWKALNVDIDCLKRNIAMVRRFEASGLQLEGKGLWLLAMLLEYGCNSLTIDEATQTVLFDTMLRVSVETSASSVCTATLLLLVEKFGSSCSHLFKTGCAIADQLPDSIAADNFIALLDFAMVCVRSDPPCTLYACKFLVSLAANVTPNHKANYFLHSAVTVLGGVFLTKDAPANGAADADGDTANGAGDGATDPSGAENEIKREIEAFVLVLLTYLTPLHPMHAQIIMDHPLRLPHHTIERLRREQLSEAGECAALLFLDSLCIDTNAKDELKSIISVDLMRSKMSVYRPTVTEKATKLFLGLFAEDIECSYRPRSSVDLRESSYNLRSSSLAEGEEGSPSGSSPPAARSDRSWSINGVTCLRDLLDIVLNITEAALKVGGHTQVESPSSSLRSSLPALPGLVEEEPATHHNGAAFHYLNSVIYQIGLSVQIHRIFSLHDVVARIVALILAQFEDIASFDLSNAKIIDTLFTLIGVRERCWQPFAADIVDADYMQLSASLLEHYMSLADPLMTDSSDDRTLASRPAPQDSAASHMLNSKVINFAKDKFLKDSSFLDNFLEEWEVESIETISRKLLLIYCRLQLGGFEAISGLLDLEAFEEMLWDVLSDDRHGIDAYPEMRRKCIQLFTAVGVHMQPIVTAASAAALANSDQPSEKPVKELAHAAPLAELVIKILCSHEHASATDEEDEFDLNNMQITSGTSSGKDAQMSAAKSAGAQHVRTEGGKCVSRIFRSHKHILQLRYSCLSCVMHICETTRTVRRKVIANYSDIVKNFSYLDPVKSMTPLLNLVALAAEYLTKVETAGEETIVTLLVRCLRFPDAVVRTLACEIIAVIGASSPGLLHRGICRPEVEDLLIGILHNACAEVEPQQHTGPLVRSVLKACNALAHDTNVKPSWVPSPYTYHWSRYSADISTRPLFVPAFLDTLQLVVRRASRTYIIQYTALVLSIVTCLMYSCNDGVFSSAKCDPVHAAVLKAALLEKFLPWMPIALDYLTSHRKIIRSLLVVPMPTMPSVAEGSSGGSTPSQSPKGGVGDAAALPEPPEKDSGRDKDSSKKSGGLNIMSRIKRKSNATTVIVENVVLPDRKQDLKYSPSAENLAEKLIEALHAFLCMDEMFPLSTYLQNATLFNGTPVIACVSYFMTECRSNLKLQRRGIDFLRHFADNQIGLSSIAMHAPSAILHAARILTDTLEVQYSFCKIVSAVARSDEFARENFIRFNVQGLLVELILRQHPEQSRLACIAITDLCCTQSDTISVCQGAAVVESVIALVDALPADFKVQMEAARVLVTADQIPELTVATRKVSTSQILKKTKKFLINALKQETLPDGYERADLEALLASPLWAKDPLLAKIMGFFG